MPQPITGFAFDAGFPKAYQAAIAGNPALHDGAILIGREAINKPYQVSGWSARLFPPTASVEAEPNRGSAYNSCLAMSKVDSIDSIYLLSGGCLTRFRDGVKIASGIAMEHGDT